MPSQLLRLLTDLSKNPGMVDEMLLDPDGFLDRFDLSDEEREAVKSRSADRIHMALSVDDALAPPCILPVKAEFVALYEERDSM